MTKIPQKVKNEILADPKYKFCALHGYHECGGRITWEHTMIYAGKQVQEKWAIIALCERGHAVNSYQDAGTLNKERNVWVALNQATEEDFKHFPRAFPTYHEQRERLNRKYGVYYPKFVVHKGDTFAESGINYSLLRA